MYTEQWTLVDVNAIYKKESSNYDNSRWLEGDMQHFVHTCRGCSCWINTSCAICKLKTSSGSEWRVHWASIIFSGCSFTSMLAHSCHCRQSRGVSVALQWTWTVEEVFIWGVWKTEFVLTALPVFTLAHIVSIIVERCDCWFVCFRKFFLSPLYECPNNLRVYRLYILAYRYSSARPNHPTELRDVCRHFIVRFRFLTFIEILDKPPQ